MEIIIVLTSATYAAKAQELLKKSGISSVLTRNAQTRSIRGCGYGLQINTTFLPEAQRILKENGIKIAATTGVNKR